MLNLKHVVAVGFGLSVFSASAAFSPANASAAELSWDSYNKLFPYYAEFCAVTQILKKDVPGRVSVRGGKGGHGVLYLRGACRDTDSPYPKVKVCDGNEAEQGVGISVNSDFDNVNWIAIENKSFFLRGGLSEADTLTQEVYEKTLNEAVSRQLFRGVKAHPELLDNPKLPQGITLNQFLLEDSASTDYAINFGRNLYCAYMPIKKELVAPIVKKLNEMNEEYYLGGKEYHWSGPKNNCTHTTHNALAAIGMWDELLTDRTLVRQIFNLAIPSNDFIDMVEIGNERDLSDVYDVWSDKSRRASLLEHGWVATQHGAIAENIPIHQKNDLYDEDLQFFILDFPLIKPNTRKLEKIVETPEYTDLRKNLLTFKDRYLKVKAGKKSPMSYLPTDENGMPIDEPGFVEFHKRYFQYIDEQIADVDQKLQALDAIESGGTSNR